MIRSIQRHRRELDALTAFYFVLASLATSGTAASIPPPPLNLLVVPGDTEVALVWEAAPGAISYNVQRAASVSGTLTLVASNLTTTRFVNSSLNNGVTYSFAVSSVGVGGESAPTARMKAAPSARVLDLLPAGAKVEKLAGGFQFIEGPAWMPVGFLVFSDIPANRLYRWTPGSGISVFRSNSGQANGNTIDPEGRLITCEHANRRVSRTEPDGTITSLVTNYNGKRFNAPNDAVVKSDGSIWFTDPDYGLGALQPKRYVFRFHPTNSAATLTTVATNFDQPNGLCFSPDESLLYIADSGALHHVRVFDVLPTGSLTNSRIFAVINPGGPDGMRCDSQGRLFVAAGDGVQIFDTKGTLIGKVRTPETAANVGFGGPNRELLFITANTSLYGISRMPDLAVSSVTLSPPSPLVGQPLSIRAIVKNQGTAPSPAGVAIRVGISLNDLTNVLWADGFTNSIPPDGSVLLSCNQGPAGPAWTTIAAGTQVLRAIVDDLNRVAESNETNNIFTVRLVVQPVPPDTDGDGLSDSDELQAGTLPNDSASVFKIVSTERTADNRWKLTWSSVPGKNYRVACQSALTDLDWVDVSEMLTASGTLTSWTNTSLANNARTFLRVRLAQ